VSSTPVSSTPASGITRNPANEETAVLTPVTDRTSAIDRIPLSHKRRWILLTSVLGVLLATAIGFVIYLWDVSTEWEAQVIEVNAANIDLGDRLATEQAEVVRQQQEIDLLNTQLKTAQTRIIELADINAQSGDNVQYYAQEINRLNETIGVASAVANALDRCVEGHGQLLNYVRNPGNYDAAEVAAFEASLNTLCANAVSANLQLQNALSQ
jgi:hypothetical protein